MISSNVIMGKKCRIDDNCYLGYKEHGGQIALGDNVRISHGCVIRSCTGNIKIGNNTSVGYYSIMHGLGGIEIGSNVLISPNVHIYAQNHGIKRNELIAKQKNTGVGIKIEDDIWIGANSVICDGSYLSQGCILGAGSVLTKSCKTKPYEIWAGNPAVKIGDRS